MPIQPKRDVVIVETPFQLLCAYEYIQKHQTNPFFILRKSGVGANDEQLDAMIQDLNLTVSLELKIPPSNKFRTILGALITVIKNLEHRDKIIIGSYFSRTQRLLASLLIKREVVLLDDGVATLYADTLIRKDAPHKYSTFSIFPLDCAYYRTCEQNNFDNLRKIYKTKPNQTLSAFFIGQKLVDIDAIKIDDYLKTISHAAIASQPSTLYYIPHRAEGEEYLKQIAEIPGVSIMKSEFAIEYFLLKLNIYPNRIFSIISTALYSLATLYPNASIFCLKPKTLRSDMFPHYDLIMSAFQNHPNNIIFNEVN